MGKAIDINKVKNELQAVHASIDWVELMEYENDPHVPVRLQVTDWNPFSFNIKSGSSDYDQDHTGSWGASLIKPDDTPTDLRETARELIEQARDHYAQKMVDKW